MQPKFEHHPIQLNEITVLKLNVTVNDPVVARDYEGEISLRLDLGRSEFDRDAPNVLVGLRVFSDSTPSSGSQEDSEQKEGQDQPAFSIEVELLGHFTVDYSKFKFEHLDSWTKVNAPFLLLPFVREQVYGLAVRAGIKGLVFPLFVQPGSGPRPEKVAAAPGNS